MQKIRFGVLGVSNHFMKRILFPLKRSAKAEVVAIASRNEEKASAFAKRHAVKKWYGSYDALLEDPEIDAVYIPLPNHLHAEYSIKAAKAGKHILCEKPLAMNHKEVNMMVSAAEDAGVLIMEAFMYRFHPQWIKSREIVLSGELGSIVTTICHFSYDNRDPSNIRNIRAYGGGALLDLGVYAVSSSRFLMDSEPGRVFCEIVRDADSEVDIHTSGILDYGTTRSLFAVSTRTSADQRFHVFGSSGKLSVEVPLNMYPDVPGHLTVATSIGTREIYTEAADQYLLQFEAFAEAVASGGESPIPGEDSLLNMRTVDALFGSARQSRWIEL